MTKLQRFIPQTPDPYLRQGDQLGAVKFGHLNALVDALNATVFGDYLQLAGDGPMSTTLRALEDPEGNIANLYLATDKTAISGSLKIGNNTSNLSSAILQIDSTSQGVLFPRMTIAERDAIVSPAIGLLVYNTTDLVLNGWDGTQWTEVGGGGGLGLLDDALMTSTLTSVVDKENTASPLKLSTNLVSVGSTLQISTDDTTYIDAEDSLGNNRFTISRVVGQQEVNVDFASNPTDGATKVGAIRTYQDGVNLSDAISVEKNGQATFTERVKIEADSTATTQATAVIQATDTNSGIALVPNGTGAITAQIPDGTAAGGNERGANAVDFQMSRTSGAQVAASPNSVIAGGANNRIRATTNTTSVISGGDSNLINSSGSGTNNTIAGGFSNSITGVNSNWNTISGGSLNNASTIYNTISGGNSNTASSDHSTISGGQSNTASTGTHATVVGGQSNVSSGQSSVSGGLSSTASGSRSVALGASAIASNSFAFAFGLNSNVSSEGSVGIGYYARCESNASYSFSSGSGRSYLFNQKSHGNRWFSNAGNAEFGSRQFSELIAFAESSLNSASTTILSLDGTGTTNLIIPFGNRRAWNVKVETIAVVTLITGTATGVSVGDALMQDDTLLFTRVSGTSSVIGVNNTNIIASTSMGSASMSYSAGASQELQITFTAPTFVGGGSVTCRVVSKVSLVEVAW
jgi:hypothetical protein